MWLAIVTRFPDRATAKSVFQFDVQGSVAKSTHTEIPWLGYVRQECRRSIHFWPMKERRTGQAVLTNFFTISTASG
jgi:hypothetical protein